MAKLPAYIQGAIKSGPIPKVRNWRAIKNLERLTRAELIMKFIEVYLVTPEGSKQGEPFKLELFQEVFIYAIYDNNRRTRRAYLSIARKNGKTGLIAALLLAHIIGPASEGKENSQIISGAHSRDQAAIVYNYAEKILLASPELSNALRSIYSSKRIVNVSQNIEYKAISAEGKTAHGLSPVLAILDEVGQIVGPSSPFVDAVTTSQGAHADPLLIAISTSAASDADLFSLWCDDAERSADEHTVCHVYKADEDADLLDASQWKKANPALDKFRDRRDLQEQLERASRVPAMEAATRNLLLNQRVALESLWLAAQIWKQNKQAPDNTVFQQKGVCIGLDLSKRNDLTAAVIAAEDDNGVIHLRIYAFTPLAGIDERSRRDRVPYNDWARDGLIYTVPGETIDYDYVADFLRMALEAQNIAVNSIEFDRWRINEFKAAALRQGFASFAEWREVGQGLKDMSPRVDAFETALLQKRLRHGAHPVLTLGASSAIAVSDPAGNRKLDKSKSSNKIDGIVAAVMAVYPLVAKQEQEFDVAAMIG